jgi:hypothetical protein
MQDPKNQSQRAFALMRAKKNFDLPAAMSR